MPDRQFFLDHLAIILDVPSGSLNGDEKLMDLYQWNSLAMLDFIALGDEHFSKSLSPREFASCETVNDLGALLGVGN